MNCNAEEKQIEQPSKRRKLLPLILIGVVIVSLWAFTPLLIKRLYPDPIPLTPETLALVMAQRGQFGDMFGAVNALFSGLAFLGAIYALVLQSRELELQRQELIESRKEMAAQSKVFSEQLELQKHEIRQGQQPVFIISQVTSNQDSKMIKIENRGALITDLRVGIETALQAAMFTVETATSIRHSTFETWNIFIRRKAPTTPAHAPTQLLNDLNLQFSYNDITGHHQSKWYRQSGRDFALTEINPPAEQK